MTDIRWTKACDCRNATASMGRMIFSEATPNGPVVTFKLTTTLRPVCDVCDTPWERVES